MARNKLHPIPHPPRTPLLGNMLTVDGDAPVQDLMRIAREQGPIFWLDMMGTPLVVVSGADLVAELCDEKRFDKAVRGSLRRVRMLGGDALFTAETQEPNWQKAHNILLPTFAHRMMQTYHEGMLDIAEQLVHQVGAAERRRGDRRGARHDRAHPRHDRPVRLQLPLQLVLPQRQPSLCRVAGARARGGDEDARPAAARTSPSARAARSSSRMSAS